MDFGNLNSKSLPRILINGGPSDVENNISIETMKNLKNLIEKIGLTKYTFKDIEGVMGIFVSYEEDAAYNVYELLLKLTEYFPTKSDIARIEEKIDTLSNTFKHEPMHKPTDYVTTTVPTIKLDHINRNNEVFPSHVIKPFLEKKEIDKRIL